MSDQQANLRERRARLGIWALVAALVPAASVVGIILLASSDNIDLPEWVVVVVFVVIPLIIIVSIVLAIAAFVSGSLGARILAALAVLVIIIEFIAGADLLAQLAAI